MIKNDMVDEITFTVPPRQKLTVIQRVEDCYNIADQ